jgi:hypothetical protein
MIVFLRHNGPLMFSNYVMDINTFCVYIYMTVKIRDSTSPPRCPIRHGIRSCLFLSYKNDRPDSDKDEVGLRLNIAP